MDIVKLIDDQTIFIMPDCMKQAFLKNNQRLLNFKSYTKEELQKKLLFDYDKKTIYYLVNNYHLKEEVALVYLNNMYYLDEYSYKSQKLNDLLIMKQALLDNNLLIKDPLFESSLENKKIIVYGYDYIDLFFKRMLDIIGKNANVKIIINNEIKDQDISLYEFDHIDSEINFVAHSICQLIKKGININNIKLGNVKEEYMIPLKRICSFYNILINTNDNMCLYSSNITLSFIDSFKQTLDFDESLKLLMNKYDLSIDDNLVIYNKIINICNGYVWFNKDIDNIIDMLIYDFKNTYINRPILKDAVEVIELHDNIIEDDKYVFILGFNQGLMPNIYKNEDFITDDLKKDILIETTNDKNDIAYQTDLMIIKRLSKVIITYKLKTNEQTYYPSSLINDLKINAINNPNIDLNPSYSKIQDEISLSKKMDQLVKYDHMHKDIITLYNNYKDIPYRSYNNKYKMINNDNILTSLKPKLKLSYSSLNSYYECSFKYYLTYILRLNKKEETFTLLIGNLFHYVLSLSFKPNFDFDKAWDNYLGNKELSNKESFLLSKLKIELQSIISMINEQNKSSLFDKAMYEQKINLDIADKVIFDGVIDKIMYKQDNDKTLIVIVDYKTGKANIKLKNIEYGLNMQLPTYIFLATKSGLFNNPLYVGFYLQEILGDGIRNDHKKTYEVRKQDNIKLKGYTLDNKEYLEQFDLSYADSRVIASMKMTSNGFSKNSKVKSIEQINELEHLVESKINEAAQNILKGHFDINPKRIDGDNISCSFCEFKDICYMRADDIITFSDEEEIDDEGDSEDE